MLPDERDRRRDQPSVAVVPGEAGELGHEHAGDAGEREDQPQRLRERARP
jgi:hypothetical protein